MELRLEERGDDDLAAHATIPIAFTVEGVVDPRPGGELVVRPVAEPWCKDYDAEPDSNPSDWATRFNTTDWRVISAWADDERIGGLVIFADVPGVEMLEGRSDLALIWDLRVTPAARGQGVGTRLLAAAMDWARARGCREIKVETQDINAGACRLYAKAGFQLRSVRRGAYPLRPDELELLWYKQLG